MAVKFTQTRTISGGGRGPSVGELRKLLEGVPDEKRVSITYYAGDQRDGSSWSLTVDELS